MTELSEIVKAVQVGTRNLAAPRSEYLDEFSASSPEMTALIEAGALSLMREAGVTTTTVAPLEAAPAETKKTAYGVDAFEEAMADAAMAPLVMEWISGAARIGLIAPPRVVLKLLQLPIKQRTKAIPVLGERGLWLAALMGIEFEEDLSGAEIDRAVLTEVFDELDWKERAKMVAALANGLSAEDVELLERALADRRKEVRDPALDLLLRLPDSPHSKTLRSLAERALLFKSSLLKKTLVAEAPETGAVPGSLPGWLPRTSKFGVLGPKALAMMDLAMFVRPGVWCEVTGLEPIDLLGRADQTEYQTALIEGWTAAAVRFEDKPWIEAIFTYYSKDAKPIPAPILERLPWRSLEETLRRSLSGSSALPSWLVETLRTRGRVLSPELSSQFVLAMQRGRVAAADLWSLGLLLDPAVLSTLSSEWPTEERFGKIRRAWHRTLDMRVRLDRNLRVNATAP